MAPDDTARPDVDVVVIGGGPAGLAAGIACASLDVSTRIIESHALPHDKACGEGLLPNSVAALGALGVSRTCLASRGSAIAGVRYITARGRTAESRFTGESALGIRRTDLIDALVARARTLPHLQISQGRAVVSLAREADVPEVQVGAWRCRPKLIVAADGLHSAIRRALGIASRSGTRRWGCRQHFDVPAWTDRVEVYFGAGFEVYVTPLPDGINVAVLWDAARIRPPAGTSPVAALVSRVETLATKLRHAGPTDAPRGAGPFDLHVSRPFRRGVVCVGDASGYLDALTGEGVGIALDQACRLARSVGPALLATPSGSVVGEDVLQQFVRATRAAGRSNRQLTRALLKIVRYPAAVECAVGLLRRQPALFRHLLEMNVGQREWWQIGASTRAAVYQVRE